MKKNLYYRATARRDNMFKIWLLSFFSAFASNARLLLEVFIRKDFGERYFRLSSVFILTVILAVIPIILFSIGFYPHQSGSSMESSDGGPSLWPGYLGWYLFLAAFVFVSIRHHRDKQRNPSVFDFAKYSLYRGKLHPAFFQVQIPGIKTDYRVVECLLEPAPFFIAGILLYLIGQALGALLIFCSVCYALGYVSDYMQGDDFVMDKIDEIICNEELEKSFIQDADEKDTRGFRFRGHRPDTQEMRRQLLPLMTEDEEILVAK